METEFPGRFKRLFAWPLWSGQGSNTNKDPRHVSVGNDIDCKNKQYIILHLFLTSG